MVPPDMTPQDRAEAAARIRYVSLDPRYVPGAAVVEHTAFPTASPDDLLSESDLYAYCETFPEGAFVALDGERVVGLGTGILIDFDFDHIQHTISDVTGENQCANHTPDGPWYYGTDITVLPEYRGCGIGRSLYQLRKDVVRRLNRRGIIAGGHLPGFADHKEMGIEAYVAAVVAGDLHDSTLSFQLGNGFEVRGIIDDYMDDPAIDNKASLIVWENPDYEVPAPS